MRETLASPVSVAPSQFRLLFVGTSEAAFSRLRELLLQECHGRLQFDHAADTEDAIHRNQLLPYDLLLCDYEAGNGKGLRLLHAMRKTSPAIPVIFLSDHIGNEAVREAIEAGTCGCMQISSAHDLAIAWAIRSGIDKYCKERQRQRTEETLRKFWRAVEQSAELIVITDQAGVMEYVNPAFEALTGYSRSEVIGQNLRMMKSKQQSFELYQDMWQSVLSGNIFHGVLLHKKKNGETFVAEKTITPLRDGEGRITHFVSCDRDITERRRLEAQLQQAQKMDAVGRLAGGVAHDFNNLLMVIGAYAELMQDSLAVEHPLRHNVQEILSASRRAADLTRQLLAFGRKQVQSLQLLDLNQVLKEIAGMLPRLIGEDIELEFFPGVNLGHVRADPVQIEQIVMNLAANARDAMPSGGKLTVETSRLSVDETYVQRHPIVPPGEYVVLSVADSGQGIAPKHLAHIFEPFYTTKSEGKGTGLGLATVYGIVKQSGGFIWVYSEIGMGTTFKIYLPRMIAGKSRLRASRSVEQTVAPGTETILLVEDESAVRKSTAAFLGMHGYTVLEADNGTEAIAVAQAFPSLIHMMITDVVMPKMGGAALAKELASSRPEMRVLFVSGYAEKTVHRRGNIDITTQFLQKPFSLKILAGKIREILKKDALVEHHAALIS